MVRVLRCFLIRRQWLELWAFFEVLICIDFASGRLPSSDIILCRKHEAAVTAKIVRLLLE